jgi:uncharacterized NAD-dependent epimerase/dehydratase family protein
MTHLTTVQLEAPYLILIGDVNNSTYAKTGFGLVKWCPERVAGQLRFPGNTTDLGVPDMTVEEAVEAGVKSLVIGVAPIGGVIPDSWWHHIEKAAAAGLDIICGLHIRLADFPAIVKAAESSGARLVDVRVPPGDISVGTGRKRTGKRILTVGTDCAIGKKYTALAIQRSMQAAGIDSTFRATGQTGIMIAGEGIPIDAVVADFIAGAAERISPDNKAGHWDVIEGQGSLFHPAYSGVSLGLLHGSQPDAFVVCHDAVRRQISGWEHLALPSVADAIEQHRVMGSVTNPGIRCAGVSINTSALDETSRRDYLAALEDETGLPCVDPVITGCDAIVTYLLQNFEEE